MPNEENSGKPTRAAKKVTTRAPHRHTSAGHYAFFAVVILAICATMVIGAADLSIPDSVAYVGLQSNNIRGSAKEQLSESLNAAGIQSGIEAQVTPQQDAHESNDKNGQALPDTSVKESSSHETNVNVKAMVGNFAVKEVDVKIYPDVRLIPCGSIFGVKFFTKGVLVVGTSDVQTSDGKINPAKKAGLRQADTIRKINGIEVNTVEDAAFLIESAKGSVLPIEFERNGEILETSLLPVLSLSESGSKYKSGLWIRDSTAGIGTVTYYDPETGMFGGLGHGICDIDTGKLMPLLRATIVDITLTDVIKGEKGRPGELKGTFGNISRGSLLQNTPLGVFGQLDKPPYDPASVPEALPIALSDSIHEGKAEIYSTVDGATKQYSVNITKIYKNDGTNKNFVFEVDDPALIETTGGIVQGMSGSPIIQDNRIIGAVTHVMINDPQKGYGVFIENMLSEAEKIK